MDKPEVVTGDGLVNLIGLQADAQQVQASLAGLARGMQPELDPEDDEVFVDWVTVNEIGLEFGFEDETYVRALDFDRQHRGPLLLTQLYFYAETVNTQAFPYPLPFGLDFADDRAAVRRKLAEHEATRRSYIRDAWRLPNFHMTSAYRKDTGGLESLLCYVPHLPWPLLKGELERVAPFAPEALAQLFGLRWTSAILRDRLDVLDFASALPEVRSEHSADLRMLHGIEFTFAPGSEIPAADPRFPQSPSLASVTYYGARVYDAREWAGAMPLDLTFGDSQADIATKLGRKPDARGDFDRNGYALWHLDPYTLRTEYSNIENRLLRATIMAPGYWEASEIDSTSRG